MRFEQVQRLILAKKIFWGYGHFNVIKNKGIKREKSQVVNDPRSVFEEVVWPSG